VEQLPSIGQETFIDNKIVPSGMSFDEMRLKQIEDEEEIEA